MAGPSQPDSPQDEPTPQSPPEPESGGEQPTDTKESTTFTKSQVGRMIAAEVRKYSDYDKLKADSEALQQLQQSQQTDMEKLQGRATSEEQRRIELEREIAELRLVRSVESRAQAKKIPTSAAVKMIDVASVQYDDDGNPSNIDDLLDSLIETEPWLVQNGNRSNGSADQGPRPQARDDDPESWSVDTFRKKLAKG